MTNTDVMSATPFIYSPEQEDEPAVTVVEAVSWSRDIQPEQLTSLQEVIDLDTLNTMFDGSVAGRAARRRDLELSFRYADCHVTVEQGRVWINRD